LDNVGQRKVFEGALHRLTSEVPAHRGRPGDR
jgi:hypothetical protein